MISVRRTYAVTLCVALLCMSTQVLAANLPDFTNLAENSGAAVVNISTEKTIQADSSAQKFQDLLRNHPEGTPFNDFFDQFEKFLPRPNAQPRKTRSLGSGFIISEDGFLVTNFHVIKEADVITVNLQTPDQQPKSYTATIVGTDPETDLALLKIKADRKFPTLSFGNSDKLKVGEWVMAIGNPFGLDHTVTAGIVSAKGRNISAGPFDDFIQTDASINPGNSGGPLINMAGEVIGINTAIIARGQGIGFAIPSSLAKQIITQLKEEKQVRRGWIGVSINKVDENTAKALGLKNNDGAFVANVIEGQPADKAGLKAGDIILQVNEKHIKDPEALIQNISALPPGDKARLTIWREGKKKTITLTLGERNAKNIAGQNATPDKDQSVEKLGLSLRELTVQEAKELHLPSGTGLLITKVIPQKPAAEAGLQAGNIILQVNMKPVTSVETFLQLLNQEGLKRGAILLQVKQRGTIRFTTIPLDK